MATRETRRYFWLAGTLVLVGMMTVLVSYSVTLYRVFCSATGAGGTTQRVASDTAKPTDHFVTVYFDSNVAPGMPWRFHPLQRSVRVRLGEETPIFYEAENISDHDIVGRATFNVTPDKSGIYFKKIECFCFTEEKLAAHTKVQMPVEFYVDPRLATDPATRDVDQITLSYTFFRAMDPAGAKDLSRFLGKPTPEMGATLFAKDCSTCHDPDRAKVGPALGGVVGRTAGTEPGYPYTSALAKSGVVWTAQSLDRWLAGPRQFLPGAAMPMAVSDPNARAAIIAYLETLKPPAQQATAAVPSTGG